MDRLEQILATLGSLALIAGVAFYISTHVDCGKIPFVGSVCVASK